MLFLRRHTIFSLFTGRVYMTRTALGPLRLHVFHRGDDAPDCHDHPWDFWTFPLVSYVEEVVDPTATQAVRDGPISLVDPAAIVEVRLVRAFRLHHRRAEHTHRVLGAWSGRWLRQGKFLWYPVNGFERADDPCGVYEPEVDPKRRVVTLVWTLRIRRRWGFFKLLRNRACWTDSQDYIEAGGHTQPCDT